MLSVSRARPPFEKDFARVERSFAVWDPLPCHAALGRTGTAVDHPRQCNVVGCDGPARLSILVPSTERLFGFPIISAAALATDSRRA